MSIWISIATTAPSDYDSEGTRRLCDRYGIVTSVGGMPPQTVRIVDALGRKRAEDQRGVYVHNLYLGLSKESFDARCAESPNFSIKDIRIIIT